MGPEPSFAAVLRNRLVPNGALQVLAQVADQSAIVQLDIGPFVEPQLRVGADVDCRSPSPSTIGRGEGIVEPDHVAIVSRPNAVSTDDDLARPWCGICTGQMWPLIPVEARSLQVRPESVER